MSTIRSCQKHLGFSRFELVVTLGAIALLGGLVCVYIVSNRRVSSHLTCAFNLKEISLAESEFQKDRNDCFPWMLSTNEGGTLEYCASGAQTFRHFQIESNNLLMCMLLVCPQDTRVAANNFVNLANENVSYFVDFDVKPNVPMTIVHGDRNITRLSGAILQTTPSTTISWVKNVGLHGDKGHLVFEDGHVEELDSAGLANAVQRTGIATNHFTVP
jgi:hypothetical protein